MGSVLLATDGSEYARVAARRAVDAAERRDADLHVLHMVDRRKLGESALSTDELAAILAEDHGYASAGEVGEMAEGTGVSVESTVRRGVPHEEIVAFADRVDAEVIVVGEHGRHDDHLGGVGRRVARGTDREVLVASAEPEVRA